MTQTNIVSGDINTVSANTYMTSKVDLGESLVCIRSEGGLPGSATGNVEIIASGKLVAHGGKASLQLTTDIAKNSNAVLDGGPAGTVTICNGLPVGTAQTINLDSKSCNIEISNGNVPGTTQSIHLDGPTQSIELNAGGTPTSPSIKMSPTGIVLSYGPANSIEIGPEGIKINGLLIDIAAMTNATVKSNAMVEVSGSAMTTIKGGMVMIN